MKTRGTIGMAVVMLIVLLAGGAPVQAQRDYDYVDIQNPSLQKIPIAVPPFRIFPAGRPDVSRDGADRLSSYLDFTGYFKILDGADSVMSPDEMGLTEADVRFKEWTRIGAELLVTAGVRMGEDGVIEMELRLLDTVKGAMLVGKRYKGWLKDQDRMIRRFAGEIIHVLTGEWGVFDTRIAFVSTGTGHKEIFVCDFDGENVRQLTRHGSITLSPAWSSDGQWIAYTSYAGGKPEIYVRHMSENRGSVIANRGLNATPEWVPGKAMLGATFSHEGDPEIYLLTREGKVTKRLTDNWGIDTSPTWSPDGSRMAFVSDRSGSPQIYIQDLSTGDTQRLTFDGRYNTQPGWSPRGDQIAYSGMKDGEINIYVIGLDGGPPVQLTRGERQNESPSWSPDGSMIVFCSTRQGPSRIFVMTAYGTDQRRLLTLPGEQTDPSWSPRMSNE